jgi:hypothetical protein
VSRRLWIGLLVWPIGAYWLVRRSGRSRPVAGLAAVVLSVVLLAVLGALISPPDDPAATSQPAPAAATKPKLTASQLRAERARAARLARQHARARAKAACLARERPAARARARAAYIAAANRWHRGYYQQDGNVFWRWRNGLSCEDYALNGCWHVEVITRYGCGSYVAVNANEYRRGAIVNQLLDNQGYGIPPKTPRIFELDSDAESETTAGDITIECS